MASGFSVGGLITGLDSNTIITQLIQIERQPITRPEDNKTRISMKPPAAAGRGTSRRHGLSAGASIDLINAKPHTPNLKRRFPPAPAPFFLLPRPASLV